MDSYNQKLLNKDADPKVIIDRLKFHWNEDPKKAAECIACGQCEGACTQHIDIIERLKAFAV
jgi:predicted aldo/keto reductase-like oxidoreductase